MGSESQDLSDTLQATFLLTDHHQTPENAQLMFTLLYFWIVAITAMKSLKDRTPYPFSKLCFFFSLLSCLADVKTTEED